MKRVRNKKSRRLTGNRILFALALVLLLGDWGVNRAAQQHGAPAQHPTYRQLTPYVALFLDSSGALPFSAIEHQPFVAPRDYLNFGYTDDAIWLRVSLKQEDFPQDAWLIQFGIPYLDRIDSYQRVGGEVIHYHKGSGTSLWTSPLPHRDSLIPVHFDHGAATIYLRIYSRDGTTINAALMTQQEFDRRDQVLRFFLGGYVGILTAMAIYNFFIFLSLRDRRYG